MLVRSTYALRRTGIDRSRNEARCDNSVEPRKVIREPNDIIGKGSEGSLPLNNCPDFGCICKERRHLHLAGVTIEVLEDRGNYKRAIRRTRQVEVLPGPNLIPVSDMLDVCRHQTGCLVKRRCQDIYSVYSRVENGEGDESSVYNNTPATSTTPTQSPEHWGEEYMRDITAKFRGHTIRVRSRVNGHERPVCQNDAEFKTFFSVELERSQVESRTENVVRGESINGRECGMTSALDVSTCGRDCSSGTTHIHFTSCLCRNIEGFHANTRAYGNRGSMI